MTVKDVKTANDILTDLEKIAYFLQHKKCKILIFVDDPDTQKEVATELVTSYDFMRTIAVKYRDELLKKLKELNVEV
jgi:hypothetical protein